MNVNENERAARIQAALHQISISAQETQDMGEFFQVIHTIIAGFIPAQNFFVALYDEVANHLNVPYSAGEFHASRSPQKPGRGLTEYVLRNGQPLLVTPEVYRQLLERGEVEPVGGPSLDWLAVPLKTTNRVIGLMVAQTCSPAVHYTQADQDTLFLISTQVAILIEHKRVETTLRASEDRYRLLFENAPVGIFLANTRGEVVEVNPTTLQILGAPSVEATKRINILTFPPLIHMGFSGDAQRCIETGNSISMERSYISRTGVEVFFHYHIIPILDEDNQVGLLQVMIEDITERKHSEDQIRKLNRMLQVISQVNQALVRAVDESDLMGKVCRVLEEVGGYRLSWIAASQPNLTEGILPLAAAGSSLEAIAAASASWANSEPGSSPIGDALQSGRPVVVQDLAKDLEYSAWRRAAQEQGFAAFIALPMLSHGHAFGSVNVFSSQKEMFINEEIDLLIEMANDVAYGIMALREVSIRKQVEIVLRESEEQYRNVVERANDGIAIIQGEQIVFANQRLAEIWGGSLEEILGSSFMNYLSTVKAAEILEYYRKRIAGEDIPSTYATEVYRKDGRLIDVEINAGTFPYQGQLADLVIIRDITERRQAEQERLQRLAELEAVNHLSTTLRSAQDLEEMLPRFLYETLKMINTSAGAIYLYDFSSGELRSEAAQDWFILCGKTPVKPGEGAGGIAFSTSEPIWIPEYATAIASRVSIPPGWCGVCLPIRTPAETTGIFYVAVQHPRQLQPGEVHLLTILSEIAGNAIHRMRLHAQTERHVQRLNALRMIDMTITASQDLRVILDVTLEQVISQLNAHASDVLLLNERTNILETLVVRGFPLSNTLHSQMRMGEGYAGRVALERRVIATSIPDKSISEPGRQFLSTDEVYKTYYGVPLIAKGRVKGVLELFFRNSFNPDSDWLDFLETLASQTAIAIDSVQLFDYLQRMNSELAVAYDTTIEGWSHALELRDRDTEGHTRRVAEMTIGLARYLQAFSEEHLIHLRWGALLHDIGKMGVPDEILMKPGPLTDEEWKVMRKHSEYAYNLLCSIEYLQPALDIPHYHHERWDGKGYPYGLKGEQIPLEARVFSVVDVWDALTSDRPYRKAWKPEQAKEYIQAQAGTQFDPPIVTAFMRMLETGVSNTSGY